MVIKSTISPLLKIGLQSIGAWPDMPYAIVSQTILMLITLCIQCFQYQYAVKLFQLGELQKLMRGVPSTVHYFITMIKLMTLWTNRRLIREILASMDSDWRECAKIDQHLHLMTTKASISHFCSNILFSLNTCGGFLYHIGDNVLIFLHLVEKDNNTSPPYPVKIEFPFVEAEETPIYEIIFIVLFLHGMANAYTITIVSSLLFSLVLHASGQIDIIHEETKNLTKMMPYYKPSENRLALLIEKHHKVILFSDNINKLFSFISLCQVFLNSVVICALGVYLMTIMDQSTMVIIQGVFVYIVIMMEIFVYCFAGEYISLKSKSLADAAYNSLWYNMPSSERKIILFILMRSQKQLNMRAGNMKMLSLELFANIAKASASYASVLHAAH